MEMNKKVLYLEKQSLGYGKESVLKTFIYMSQKYLIKWYFLNDLQKLIIKTLKNMMQ